MSTKDLFSAMNDHWTAFQENHEKYAASGNKAAGTRARKSVGELKKLVTEYRKASVSESK